MITVRRKPSFREQGFTLIEVIISISILAVIITISYKLISGIINAKMILDDQRDGMFIANSVVTRLSRELQLADNEDAGRKLLPTCDNVGSDPVATTNNSSGNANAAAAATPGPAPIFTGENTNVGTNSRGDTITFLAREAGQYIPDGGSHSGVVQITYRVAADTDKKIVSDPPTMLLIREEMPYRRPASAACKSAIRFPITKDLISLEFWYFDKKAGEWVDSWKDQRSFKVPSMVQFRVKLRSPQGQIQTYTSAVALSASPR